MRIQHLIVFRRMHFANMVICDRMADSARLVHLGRSRPGAPSENQNKASTLLFLNFAKSFTAVLQSERHL